MSEMELSVFRQRSIEATKQKARRGELFLTVAVGYVKAGGDCIEKDADRRVQAAIALVFRKFAELQTIRQVLVWCRPGKLYEAPLRTIRPPMVQDNRQVHPRNKQWAISIIRGNYQRVYHKTFLTTR